MIVSFFVYGILTAVLFVLGRKYQTTNKIIYLFILFAIYSLVMGARYGVGKDHLTYLNTYENWEDISTSIWLRYEVGFVTFTNFFFKLNVPTLWYFTSFSFILIFLYFFNFRRTPFLIPYMALVFMISGVGITGCTNGIRQYVGAYMFMFILPFMYEKKILFYLLGVILAISFHKTMIILIPIYFITYINGKIVENNKFLALCSIMIIGAVLLRLLIGNSMLLFFDDMLYFLQDMNYDQYLDTHLMEMSSSIGLFRLVKLLFNLTVLSTIPSLCKRYKVFLPFINMMCFLWIVGLILYYLFEGSLIMERLILPFTIFNVPIYAIFLYYLSKKNSYGYYASLAILYFTFVMIIFNCKNNTARYVTIFQESEYVQKQKEVYK